MSMLLLDDNVEVVDLDLWMRILFELKASCQQRRGRTGRVFPGTCIKFFTQEFYEQMAPFDPPQMQDSPLDNLVLQVG